MSRMCFPRSSSCNRCATNSPGAQTAKGTLCIGTFARAAVASMVSVLLLAGQASATCAFGTTSPSVNICSPGANTTVPSPVQVSASAYDTAHPVVAMKVYLDYNSTAVYAAYNNNQLATSLPMSAGGHHITVNAWDSSGAVFKNGVNFSVSSTSGTISVTPSSLSFGDQIVGTTSKPQTVTFTNGTASSISISSITTTLADFPQNNNCGSSLGAGSSCQITLTFTPSSAGSKTGTLTVNDSAGTQTAALSGKGVTVTGIAVTPTNPTITVGSAQQFTATATFSDSTTGNITTIVNWTSSNTAVATITATGLAKGVAQGTTTIQASYSSASGSTTLTVAPAPSFAGVLTFHNNNLRTGTNKSETILTPSNVNVTSFGKKYTYSVDGRIYAQPLYMPSVSVSGGTHNVVFVATEHDSVYAFDADGLQSGYLWKHPMIPSGEEAIQQADLGGSVIPIGPEIGITGTPVIDPSTGALYVVTGTEASGVFKWRLHALDISTGAEKFGGPVLISASGFSAKWELQRAGLLLANGMVYIAFASEGDQNTWHGWIFGHNASTLLKTFAYNVTPAGWGGGVWQSAGGLGADASGYIYFETGNGSNNVATGGADLSDSFVKLSSSGQLVDYFSPFNHANMDCCDLDLAAGVPVLLPDQSVGTTHVMIGGGKSKSLYVVNRDHLGKFSSNSNNIIQTVNGAVAGEIFSQPAFWYSKLYIIAAGDVPRMFTFSNGLLSTSAVSKNGHTYPFPGANISVSSNGSSNGIVWAQEYFGSSSAILHAYSATNLSTELWNSNMNATRDSLGLGSKFMAATIANGKVYVGTRSKTLVVYGLLK